MKSDTELRIKKCLIRLQKQSPFFTYMSLFLKFKEVPKGSMEFDTMGVDMKGNVFYVKEFVNGLNDDKLLFVVCHELFHLVFMTELRRRGREKYGFNVASDLVINTLLQKEHFTPTKDCIIADYRDEFDLGNGKVIKEVSKKSTEEIYDLIPKIKVKDSTYIISYENGKEKELGKVFDNHLEGKNENGEKLSDKEKRELEKIWNDRVAEAVVQAQMKGNLPAGLERLIEQLHSSKINWKSLLQRYITQQIPQNFSWEKPSKKSLASGFYMPSVLKEGIKVAIGIDVSGSIGQKELTDFLSEIIGLARAYQEQLSMTLYTHEVDVNGKWEVRNGSIDEIKKITIKGGGGTAHLSLFNKLKEDMKDCKCCIFLTDGDSDLKEVNFEEYPFDKLFVISKDGSDEQLKNKRCKIIKLED